jgi:hypothetical protein
MRRLLVNNVVSEEAAQTCDFCAARHAAQAPVLKNFAERFGGAVELFHAPQQPHDIHGPGLLRAHFEQWRSAG